MAVPETHSSEELFECLKLFEVEESSPSSRGERPSRGFGMFLVAIKKTVHHNIKSMTY